MFPRCRCAARRGVQITCPRIRSGTFRTAASASCPHPAPKAAFRSKSNFSVRPMAELHARISVGRGAGTRNHRVSYRPDLPCTHRTILSIQRQEIAVAKLCLGSSFLAFLHMKSRHIGGTHFAVSHHVSIKRCHTLVQLSLNLDVLTCETPPADFANRDQEDPTAHNAFAWRRRPNFQFRGCRMGRSRMSCRVTGRFICKGPGSPTERENGQTSPGRRKPHSGNIS